MTTPTSETRTTRTAQDTDDARVPALGETLSGAAVTAKDTAADVVSRLPEVAATTRSAIEDANRQISAGSDEMLAVGTLLSYGVAMGLLLGGGSRLLVAAALVPAGMLGLNLLDRSTRAKGRSSGAGRLQGS
jgi:hypothetical protein